MMVYLYLHLPPTTYHLGLPHSRQSEGWPVLRPCYQGCMWHWRGVLPSDQAVCHRWRQMHSPLKREARSLAVRKAYQPNHAKRKEAVTSQGSTYLLGVWSLGG